MPTVLAIESSANVGAICVLRDGVATNEIVRDEVKLSVWVLPAIERALRHAGVALDAVDAFAYGSGPGSFTGVRTACATAQALAYARTKPLYAVSSLEGLAFSALNVPAQFQWAVGSIRVILDARMNEVFSAEFTGRSSTELEPAKPVSLRSLASIEFDSSHTVVGSGAILAAKRMHFSESRIDEIHNVTQLAEMQWGQAIARIALKRMTTGEAPLDPLNAEPEYVRNNVALTEDERRALRTAEASV